MSITISKISIRDFMGIEQLEFVPGRITKIRGRNAAGKTSIVEALKTVFEGGHDASLVREGADAAEVGLILSNGTTLKKRITPRGQHLQVDHEDILEERPPMAFLKGIADTFGVNPFQYVLDKKKRKEWLLEALPITLTEEQLLEAAGTLIDRVPSSFHTTPPLVTIDRLHDRIYSDRTKLNRDVDEKEKTLKQLEADLPQDFVNVVELEEQADQAAARVGELEAELQRKIQAIREEAEMRIEMAREDAQADIDEAKASAQELRHQLANAGRTNAMMDVRQKMHDELEELRDDQRRHNRAVNGLRILKKKLLDDIPIDGLEIRDGEIVKDGVPFDRLNRATQIDIVLRLAVLRAGELGIVCFDGLEALDEESQQLVYDWIDALDRELHFIFTEVGESELTIETDAVEVG